MNSFAMSFLAVASLAAVQADDAIRLPSGTVVRMASFAVRADWKQYFPPHKSFFAEKDPEGQLKGMHARSSARLDGASTVLHKNGALKILAFYSQGQRNGACRVWDDEQRLVLYSKYEDGEKNGITCLFKDGTPWLVQEWDGGTLGTETLLGRKSGSLAPVVDAQRLAEARKRLAGVEEEVAETDQEVKSRLRKWVSDERDRVQEEKDDVAAKVARAQHTQHRVNRGSRAAGFAASATNTVAAEAKRTLVEADKGRAEDQKLLYDSALAALEKSLTR